MEYTYLGRIGLQVSRLCLGTVNFGMHVSEEDTFPVLDRALEQGINFLDTSNSYNSGLTEMIIGNWFEQDRSRRNGIVLATKVYSQTGDGPNDGRLSAYHIRRACEDSLRRLQTDHIDLYQMHHIDRQTPWEEIWGGMEQLVREGKIVYVGSSNFAAWNIAQAQGIASQRNSLGLVSEQSVYNLRNRMVELEVLPCCRALGLGVIPYSPMGGGLLCGVLDNPATGRRGRESLKETIETYRTQLQAYEQLCQPLGHRPADVALAWVLKSPDIVAPIIGPRTVEQLDQNVAALELTLDAETLARLDEIWPGPSGEAPEAYAW
ncbi:MAG: aldo/keto reductase [Candidatus Poribacteria bacterium]|nr:aldo/keto reductase [Candidatus Poribacteria bacterium]